MSPGPQVDVFPQVAVRSASDFMLSSLRFHRVFRHVAEQHHLRVLRLAGESTSDRHSFGDSGIAMQVVLAGLADLAAGYEVRPVEFFEDDRQFWLMQDSGSMLANAFDRNSGTVIPCAYICFSSPFRVMKPSGWTVTVWLNSEAKVKLISMTSLLRNR